MKKLLLVLFSALPLWASAQQPGYQRRERTYAITTEDQVQGRPWERYKHTQLTAQHGIAMPMGSLKSFIGSNSKYHYAVSLERINPASPVSYGGQLSYMAFRDRLPRQLYTTSSGQDISAVQTRSLSGLSAHAFAKYSFGGVSAPLRPYVLAGLGGSHLQDTRYLGFYSEGSSKFQVSGLAGAGLRYLFGANGKFGLNAQATYFYSPFKSDFISNVSSLNVSAGVVYRWW